MKWRALLSTVWFCEKIQPGHSCIWGAPASSWAMSSGCSGTAPASAASLWWGYIVNIWRWCFLFSNCGSQGLWQARSHPGEYSVQPATVPVREFACEKQFPLVKWQLSTGETRHSLPQTDNIGEGTRKHFAVSPAHVKVLTQPVSPAVEGLICMALAMLPFWKFIISQGLCYLSPTPSFTMFSAECVSDVVRIAGKITYSHWTRVSRIAGRFFTSWAIREALNNPLLHLLSTFCIFNRKAGCKTMYRSSGLAWMKWFGFWLNLGDFIYFSLGFYLKYGNSLWHEE